MPDSLVITVEDKGVLEALSRVGTAAERRVWHENVVTGELIVMEAKARVPVRYGFLQDAIGWVQSKKTGDVFVGVDRKKSYSIPGTRTFKGKSDKARPSKYAHLVERGTSHSTAKPFLWPAARAEEASHRRRVSEAMGVAIHETGLGD